MNNTAPRRLAGLDHLRSLAIILVFLYHYRIFANPPVIQTLGTFGWTGVDLFFVLSGFLIGGQLLGALAKGKPLSYKEFYFKRALRILPAYLLILTLYFTIPAFIERSSLPPLWKFLTFTQNFGLDLRNQGAFSHAWSLCIEEQFYLVLPVFILMVSIPFISSNATDVTQASSARPDTHTAKTTALHQRLPRRLATCLIIAFLAGFLIRWCSWHFLVAPADEELQTRQFYRWIYYPTYGRLDGLLAGLGLACLLHFRPAAWQKLTSYGNKTLLLGLAAIIAACYYCGLGLFENSIAGFAFVSVAYGIIVLAALSPGAVLFRYSSRLTSFLAAISYSLYLVHKQMIHLTIQWFAPEGPAKDSYWIFALSAAFSVAAAIALHYLIERPFLQLRDRYLQKHYIRIK